jgi:hypothetical protein
MIKILDRVGHFVVRDRAFSDGGEQVWELFCICGNTVYLTSGGLASQRSCGCRRRGPVPLPLELRFWTKVDRHNRPQPTSCHGFGLCLLFTGSGNGKGRPNLVVDGKTKAAAHVAWFIEYGVWPTYLCHRCDNPRCVSVAHLFEGDHKVNQYDKGLKGRGFVLTG